MSLRMYISKDDSEGPSKEVTFALIRNGGEETLCKDQRKFVPAKGKEFEVYRKRSM